MNLKRFAISFACLVCICQVHGQKIATLEVELSTASNGLKAPVKTLLDNITLLPDSVLGLVSVNGSKRREVLFQIEHGDQRMLYFIPDTDARQKKLVYELVKKTTSRVQNLVQTKDENGTLTIHSGNQNFVRYNYKTVYPPAGVDTAFKRSGFIHPLWSPHGQVLTRIQAPDHYHHYGLWNPWTHVLYEKDTLDFWNLKDRKGTVQFANRVTTNNGPIFSEYQVLHEHVAFKKDGRQKVALNELQTVRVYQTNDPDYYIMDITSSLNCADTSPVVLLEYRYGGLGWRATEQWNKDNSEILTSEGKTRKEADGTHARWCIVQGQLGNDYGGAVMMSYPTNYNHPEPLRIWPETQNGRGDVYANFFPTRNMDWRLEPGKTYTLKYRFLVFNGKFTKEKAESGWQQFARPAKVVVRSSTRDEGRGTK